MTTHPIDTPDPQYVADLHEWLTECPACPDVFIGEVPDESIEGWRHHYEAKHRSPLTVPSDLYGLELLDTLVDPTSSERTWAVAAVGEYFRSGGFSGGRFERLGSAGDAISPNVITATDLVAVSMLGVDIPAPASLMILEDRSVDITELLSGIPDVPMYEVEPTVLRPEGAAWQLWDLLRGAHVGLGPTKTSKILARKRPHLLPVQDRRVLNRLEHPDGVWDFWRRWFHDPRNLAGVIQLRNEIGDVDDISLLRVLDVAIWRYDAGQSQRPKSVTDNESAGDAGGGAAT